MAVVLWHDSGASGPIGQIGGRANTGAASADAARRVEESMLMDECCGVGLGYEHCALR